MPCTEVRSLCPKPCESTHPPLATNDIEALEILRQRYNAQHYALRKFYYECSNLKYLTGLINVPKLGQVVSCLQSHCRANCIVFDRNLQIYLTMTVLPTYRLAPRPPQNHPRHLLPLQLLMKLPLENKRGYLSNTKTSRRRCGLSKKLKSASARSSSVNNNWSSSKGNESSKSARGRLSNNFSNNMFISSTIKQLSEPMS